MCSAQPLLWSLYPSMSARPRMEKRSSMAQIEDASFGILLRRLRLAQGLTQEELAGRAELSPAGVSALERGVRRRPYQYTITRLMTALALPPEQRGEFKALASRQPRKKTRPPFADTPNTSSMSHARARMSVPPLVGRTRETAWLQHGLAGAR